MFYNKELWNWEKLQRYVNFSRKQGARQNGGVSVLYSSFSRESSMQHKKKIPLLTNMCYKTNVKKWDDWHCNSFNSKSFKDIVSSTN